MDVFFGQCILRIQPQSGVGYCQAVAQYFAAAKICGQTYIDRDRITENNGRLAASASVQGVGLCTQSPSLPQKEDSGVRKTPTPGQNLDSGGGLELRLHTTAHNAARLGGACAVLCNAVSTATA